MKMRLAWIALLAAAVLLPAESKPKPPIASYPVVELKGKIAKVQTTAGQGMPHLLVTADGKTTKVLLGSMRYLMEQNFTPKAGDGVEVTGYQTEEEVVAISVVLPAERKTLKLRDENGYPLWMGGARGGRGRGGRMMKRWGAPQP